MRKSTWTKRLWFFVFIAAVSSVILATTTGTWGSVVPPEDVLMTGTTDPQIRTWFLMNRGRTLLAQNQPRQALAAFRTGLSLAQQHGLMARVASGMLNIGITFRYLGLPDSALHYLQEAEILAPLARSPVVDINLLAELGILMSEDLGQVDSGRVFLEKATQLAPHSRNRRVISSRAFALLHLGKLHAEAMRLDTAGFYFSRAAEAYVRAGKREEAALAEKYLRTVEREVESDGDIGQ